MDISGILLEFGGYDVPPTATTKAMAKEILRLRKKLRKSMSRKKLRSREMYSLTSK